jgi:hypothetical protein
MLPPESQFPIEIAMQDDTFSADNGAFFNIPGVLCKSQIAALALFIDAIPAEFRQELLLAALKHQPHAKGDASALAEYLFVCLEEYFRERTGGILSMLTIQAIPSYVLMPRLTPFSRASDPAQVTIALMEFLDFVVKIIQAAQEKSDRN